MDQRDEFVKLALPPTHLLSQSNSFRANVIDPHPVASAYAIAPALATDLPLSGGGGSPRRVMCDNPAPNVRQSGADDGSLPRPGRYRAPTELVHPRAHAQQHSH
jgi:hypothetical protein